MALNNGTLIHLVAREGKQDEVAAILGEAHAPSVQSFDVLASKV